MKIMNIVIKRIETSGVEEKDPIVSKLLEKGYRIDDIDTAMNLVSMLTSRVDPIVRVSNRECSAAGEPRGVRHLHASEAVRLSPDAQQLMLKLVEDGIISQLHFEKALEYIWKNDLRHVSASRMELIILMSKPMSEMETEGADLIQHSIELH